MFGSPLLGTEDTDMTIPLPAHPAHVVRAFLLACSLSLGLGAGTADESVVPGKALAGKDLVGDPLPAKCLARLGTVRFRRDGGKSLLFSPNGKLLVSAGNNCTIQVWDVDTGKLSATFGARSASHVVAFSGDGKHLATAVRYSDLGISIRDVKTRKQRFILPAPVPKTGPAAGTQALAFFADGKTLAVATVGLVVFWDIESRKVSRRLDEGIGKGTVYALDISSDGKLLAVAADDNSEHATTTIWLVDLNTGKPRAKLKGLERDVTSLAFAPNGKTLLAACFDQTVRLWDVTTGKEMRRIEARGGKAVFSPDGKTLVWGTADGTLHIWDVPSWKERRRISIPERYLTAIAFSPDNKTIATGADSAIRLWDSTTGREVRPYAGVGSPLVFGAFSPDGKVFAARSHDGAIHRWALPSTRELPRIPRPTTDWGALEPAAPSLAVSPDGKVLASFVRAFVQLWSAKDGKELHLLTQPHNCTALAFSPQGDALAVGYLGGIALWSPTSGKRLRLLDYADEVTVARRYAPWPRAIAFFPDGRALVAATRSETVRFWDWAAGRELRPIADTGMHVFSMAVSPDGKLLALGGTSRAGARTPLIRIWEIASRALIREIKRPCCVHSLAFSHDGKVLAAAASDTSAVYLWNVWTGAWLLGFYGHASAVNCVTFSPDGRSLASCGSDATVLLWDMKSVVAKVPHADLSAKALNDHWVDLRYAEVPAAHKALVALAGGGDKAVAFLARHLTPVPEVADARLGKLIANLDADAAAVREAAFAELEKLGPVAGPALTKALAGKPSLEARRRLRELVAKLPAYDAKPDELRRARAVQALELIGSEQARALLKKLAGGAAGATLSRDARGALGRLERFAPRR
jgi:WD40 repeat protein